MTATQLLDLAEAARASGDGATAETALRALFADPSIAVRSEARFRLAMIYVSARRLADAAVLLRAILDQQPGAQRVRLELARVLDLMGDEAGARRALREVQAGGLPPDVARFVDRYAAALRAQKPFGASIDIAIAPDSNINRATGSQSVGTVLGDFDLGDDARRRSGIGLALRGQVYARLPIDPAVNLLARLSGSADVYGEARFNDLALAMTAGPELRSGTDRIALEGGAVWRAYGGKTYSRAPTIRLNLVHPIGRKGLVRAAASLTFVDNRRNHLLSGRTTSVSLAYERAVSHRAGFSITLGLDRQGAASPAYATWGGQATLLAYREAGPVTLIGSVSYGRLSADKRLALFPRARSDHTVRIAASATMRNLRVGSFAPFVRLGFDRTDSTVAFYAYRKLRTELGVTRAF